MSFELTPTQKDFLAKGDRVAALAQWVIASPQNRYAVKVCFEARVPQGNRPSSRQIDAVSTYLRNPNSDLGVVARLINLYRHTHAQQP